MCSPTYNFSVSAQGLVFLGQCLGNLIGSFFCGYINDKLSQWSTRRNHGVFEPEMRLPVVIFPALLVPAGLIMFGVGVHNGVHWILPVIGAGCVGIALTGIGSIIQPYLMDSYAPVVFDSLVVSLIPLLFRLVVECMTLTRFIDLQRLQKYCFICRWLRCGPMARYGRNSGCILHPCRSNIGYRCHCIVHLFLRKEIEATGCAAQDLFVLRGAAYKPKVYCNCPDGRRKTMTTTAESRYTSFWVILLKGWHL